MVRSVDSQGLHSGGRIGKLVLANSEQGTGNVQKSVGQAAVCSSHGHETKPVGVKPAILYERWFIQAFVTEVRCQIALRLLDADANGAGHRPRPILVDTAKITAVRV